MVREQRGLTASAAIGEQKREQSAHASVAVVERVDAHEIEDEDKRNEQRIVGAVFGPSPMFIADALDGGRRRGCTCRDEPRRHPSIFGASGYNVIRVFPDSRIIFPIVSVVSSPIIAKLAKILEGWLRCARKQGDAAVRAQRSRPRPPPSAPPISPAQARTPRRRFLGRWSRVGSKTQAP